MPGLVRTVLASAAILAACGCDRGATGPKTANATPTPPASPMHVEPDVVDLGTMLVGEQPAAIVRLVNASDATVKLLQCKTSCKCTAADCPAGREFAPGESTEVSVSVKADRPGPVKQDVTFLLENHAPARVSVVGDVLAVVSADPPTLTPQSNPEGRFVLRANDGEAFTVVGATPPLLAETGTSAAEHELAIVWDRWDRDSRILTLDLDHPKMKQVRVGLGEVARDPTRPAGPGSLHDSLAVAIKKGDMDTLRTWVGDLTVPREKNSLLTRAARWGQTEAVEILLDAGADIEGGADSPHTPLMWAVQSGRAETVALLIERGADINARDENEGTALTWAAGPMGGNIETLETLVTAGADVNVADLSGMTPLMWAARYGDPMRVQALLKGGANLTLRDKQGRTAIDHAEARGGEASETIVRLLRSVR